MKAVSKLAILISLGALASFASAKTEEQAYLDSCRKDASIPVPIAVVSPSIVPGYEGTTVQIEFTVDVTGKPADFAVLSAKDNAVAATVVDAVKMWRFKPAEVDGKPVAKKVSLPVKIVDDLEPMNRLAAN